MKEKDKNFTPGQVTLVKYYDIIFFLGMPISYSTYTSAGDNISIKN